jgi:hypothetical protein
MTTLVIHSNEIKKKCSEVLTPTGCRSSEDLLRLGVVEEPLAFLPPGQLQVFKLDEVLGLDVEQLVLLAEGPRRHLLETVGGRHLRRCWLCEEQIATGRGHIEMDRRRARILAISYVNKYILDSSTKQTGRVYHGDHVAAALVT